MEREEVVQKFPYRCPYCDDVTTYETLSLQPGENKIQCPSCQRIFIKVVSDSLEPARRLPRKRKGSRGKGGS